MYVRCLLCVCVCSMNKVQVYGKVYAHFIVATIIIFFFSYCLCTQAKGSPYSRFTSYYYYLWRRVPVTDAPQHNFKYYFVFRFVSFLLPFFFVYIQKHIFGDGVESKIVEKKTTFKFQFPVVVVSKSFENFSIRLRITKNNSTLD